MFYALPGGQQLIGESLEDCLKREFMEETRINIIAHKLILVNEFVKKKSSKVRHWNKGIHQIEHIFLVERLKDAFSGVEELKDMGMTGLKWLSRKELHKVPYYPKMNIEWFFQKTGYELTYKVHQDI